MTRWGRFVGSDEGRCEGPVKDLIPFLQFKSGRATPREKKRIPNGVIIGNTSETPGDPHVISSWREVRQLNNYLLQILVSRTSL